VTVVGCQCEHEAHFVPATESFTPNARVGHSYGKVPATSTVDTKRGQFKVCESCKSDCMKDQ